MPPVGGGGREEGKKGRVGVGEAVVTRAISLLNSKFTESGSYTERVLESLVNTCSCGPGVLVVLSK